MNEGVQKDSKNIHDCPQEILTNFFSFLNPVEISIARGVCSFWRNLLDDKIFMQHMIRMYFPHIPEVFAENNPRELLNATFKHYMKHFDGDLSTTCDKESLEYFTTHKGSKAELLSAACRGNFSKIDSFPFSHYVREVFYIHVAANGYVQGLQRLFDNIRAYQKNTKILNAPGHALRAATCLHNIQAIGLILENAHPLCKELPNFANIFLSQISVVLCQAVKLKYYDIASQIVRYAGAVISPEAIKFAIKNAMADCKVEICSALLKIDKNFISQNDYYQAITLFTPKAVVKLGGLIKDKKANQLEAFLQEMELLCSDQNFRMYYFYILLNTWRQTIEWGEGYTPLSERLVEHCKKIMAEFNDPFNALQQAAYFGNKKIVDQYLAQNLPPNPSMLSALELMCDNPENLREHTQIFKDIFYFIGNYLSPQSFGTLLKLTAQHNKVNIVERLVADTTMFFPQDIGVALLKASEKGNLKVVEILLIEFYRGIHSVDLSVAFRQAVDKGQTQVAISFFKHVLPVLDFEDDSFFSACIQKNKEMILAFLQYFGEKISLLTLAKGLKIITKKADSLDPKLPEDSLDPKSHDLELATILLDKIGKAQGYSADIIELIESAQEIASDRGCHRIALQIYDITNIGDIVEENGQFQRCHGFTVHSEPGETGIRVKVCHLPPSSHKEDPLDQLLATNATYFPLQILANFTRKRVTASSEVQNDANENKPDNKGMKIKFCSLF